MRLKKKEKKRNRTVLAITDFSKSSTNAVLYAAGLFKYSALKFVLLNVFEIPTEKASLLISVDDILSKDSESGLKKQATEIISLLEERKLLISSHSQSGKLSKAVDTVIQSEDIEMIVAGIPPGKYPYKYLNTVPFLLMGQSKYPVLLVPENCPAKEIKNVLSLNLDPHKKEEHAEKALEHIINHDHISKHTINLVESKINSINVISFNKIITKQKTDLILITPSPGDRLDRDILNYKVHKLFPTVASLLAF